MISLEELKARSHEYCYRLELIKIAKMAKSPTAAHDLAIGSGFSKDEAISCRYLRIILRDYGKKKFDAVIIELEKRSRNISASIHLSSLVQVANRLHYLSNIIDSFGERIKLSDYDSHYVDVIERFVDNYDEERHGLMMRITQNDNQSIHVWLQEAKRFVFSAKQGLTIDKYTFEKTALLIALYIKGYLKENKIDTSWCSVNDEIFDFKRRFPK